MSAPSPCQCTGAGFCRRYNRQMGGRMVAICQGTVLTPKKCARYRQAWEREAAGMPPRPPCPYDLGDRLKEQLNYFGYSTCPGCNCNALVKTLNLKGPVWAEEHLDWLLAEMEKNAKVCGYWFSRIAAQSLVRWVIRGCQGTPQIDQKTPPAMIARLLLDSPGLRFSEEMEAWPNVLQARQSLAPSP